MYIDFSALFHQSSKDRTGQGRVKIPMDEKKWPKEWRTIFYKTYPRFQKISLSEEKKNALAERIGERRSRRDFTGAPLTKMQLSLLSRYTCGIVSKDGEAPHRAQPSGGGRYPVECYIAVFSEGEVPAGVYHYNVKEHALESLWQRSFSKKDIGSLFTYPWAQDASCAFFFSAVFERNQMKYGERGYRHILIEAGAIVQNLYLMSSELNLPCCAIDGVQEKEIEKLLDIDGHVESMLCSVLVG